MKMNAIAGLRHTLSHCIVEHHKFAEIKSLLTDYITDSFQDLPPKIAALVGPSRVGKSEVTSSVVRAFPPEVSNGAKRVSVLVVKTPSPVNPLTLPHSVLTALGLNVKRGADNNDLMAKQLRLAQTKTIIFEEASHVVEVGARVIPRAAGDFFKVLYEDLRLTVILVGVPHLTRLFESNEQLAWRADSPIQFLPYSAQGGDYENFGGAVISNLSHFQAADVTFEISPEEMVDHLYMCSGGLYGIAHKFFLELARVTEKRNSRAITESQCLEVVRTIGLAGHPRLMPFSGKPIPSAALAAAHVEVLRRSGLNTAPTSVV